jgi:hypothetical protein
VKRLNKLRSTKRCERKNRQRTISRGLQMAFAVAEAWVVMLALENFTYEQVALWERPQWDDFYKRINLGRRHA